MKLVTPHENNHWDVNQFYIEFTYSEVITVIKICFTNIFNSNFLTIFFFNDRLLQI